MGDGNGGDDQLDALDGVDPHDGPGCASCLTTSIGVIGDGEVMASTGCFHYSGCCGTPASRVYLVSARTAAQAALSGYLYQA